MVDRSQALIAVAVGFVSLIVVFLTCCIAMIPYVGTVILLPAFVFLKSFDLYFVEQFGEGFRIFAVEEAPLAAAPRP